MHVHVFPYNQLISRCCTYVCVLAQPQGFIASVCIFKIGMHFWVSVIVWCNLNIVHIPIRTEHIHLYVYLSCIIE